MQFWDWLFPETCLICRKPGVRLCGECLDFRKYDGSHTSTSSVQAAPPLGINYFALYEYSGNLKNILHALKYNKDKALLPYLQKALLKAPKFAADLIIPVPLNPVRQQERGFNQSAEIPLLYSRQYNIPILTDIVFRNTNTQKLAKLKPQDRAEELTGSFQIWPGKEHELSGKNILIFDDILTTGNTAKSLINLLNKVNPKSIFVLALSRPKAH